MARKPGDARRKWHTNIFGPKKIVRGKKEGVGSTWERAQKDLERKERKDKKK